MNKLQTLLAQRAQLDAEIAAINTQRRVHAPDVKQEIVAKAVLGENVQVLSDEYGVHQSLIYKWKRQSADALSKPTGRPALG